MGGRGDRDEHTLKTVGKQDADLGLPHTRQGEHTPETMGKKRVKRGDYSLWCGVVEFLAVLVALVAFFNELSYRHEERTARAWQLLTTPASGNSGKGEALAYLNSMGISLAGIDLTPPILAEQWKQTPEEDRILVGACARFTYLRKVELSEAVLVDAKLACADLQRANLRKTSLMGAWLQGADLRGARLQGASLRGARLQGVKLRGARLQRADLNGARLQGQNLRGARLQGANLRGAQLQRANLRGVWLQGANLVEAQLQGANLRKARLQGAFLNEAQLQGADLRGAQLQGANLNEAQLQGADLTGADLRAVMNIQCADLKQATNWAKALRSRNLECGQPIPEVPPQR